MKRRMLEPSYSIEINEKALKIMSPFTIFQLDNQQRNIIYQSKDYINARKLPFGN